MMCQKRQTKATGFCFLQRKKNKKNKQKYKAKQDTDRKKHTMTNINSYSYLVGSLLFLHVILISLYDSLANK